MGTIICCVVFFFIGMYWDEVKPKVKKWIDSIKD